MHGEGVRADVWLWAARLFKTRTLAKHSIEAGRLLVNGQPVKPARTLRIGDRLELVRGEERFDLAVLALAEMRGPAPVAQALYRESERSIAARAAEAQRRRMQRAGATPPATRPDKHARRLIRRLKDLP